MSIREQRRFDWFLVGLAVLTVAAVLGIWRYGGIGATRPTNSIILSVSTSYIAGVIVWLLVVWLPERRRRSILRTNFRNHYALFREDIAHVLLRAAAGGSFSIDLELPKKLAAPTAFREYFSERGNQNWYDVLNGLQANPDVLEDLLLEIDLFASEVASVVAKVEFDDLEPLAFFKRLTHYVQRLKSASVYSHDQVKYFGNFVWEIMALWSFVEGQRKEDIVEKMIDRI